MKNKKTIKKFAFSAILLAISMLLGYLEAIIPINFGQIGVKVGLGNITTILGLEYLNVKKTFIINLLRVIILGFVFGNLVRFALSLSGFILSFIVMTFMIKKFHFRNIVASIFGGVFHNIGQIITLTFIIKNQNILYLLSIYIIVGIITGLLVGVISDIIINKLQLLNLNKL